MTLLLRSLSRPGSAGGGACGGETLEPVRAGVKLEEFQRAFAGENPILQILFSHYVLAPAVQRAYELN